MDASLTEVSIRRFLRSESMILSAPESVRLLPLRTSPPSSMLCPTRLLLLLVASEVTETLVAQVKEDFIDAAAIGGEAGALFRV